MTPAARVCREHQLQRRDSTCGEAVSNRAMSCGNDSSDPVEEAEHPAREQAGCRRVRAISNPLRTTILGLLHERAATVTELATAVRRPKSTVAHHVNVLAAAGLLRVVSTRRVRAIDERYYGRTARMFYVALGRRADGVALPRDFNDFEVAAKESVAAYDIGPAAGLHPACPNS